MYTPRYPIILDSSFEFPSVYLADEHGLLAVGGDLQTERLEQAYRHGIFPWFSQHDPILWWTLSPRMVLFVDDFSPSHSLKKTLNKVASDPAFSIRLNTNFAEVMQSCAAPRQTHSGTWITSSMQQAYKNWHHQGRVHSVETWYNGELVGGLYGVNIGHVFYGESMFTKKTDASKIAFAYLINHLRRLGIKLIDCQQETKHLASLGARPISQDQFQTLLHDLTKQPTPIWGQGILSPTGLIDNETAK